MIRCRMSVASKCSAKGLKHLRELDGSMPRVVDRCLACVGVAGLCAKVGIFTLLLSVNGESGSICSLVTVLRPCPSMAVITGSTAGLTIEARPSGANVSNRLKMSKGLEKSTPAGSMPKKTEKQIGHMVWTFHQRLSLCCMITIPPFLSTNFCT